MYAALFKHKWPLLAFVVITLAGVQFFVGREGDEGVLGRATQDLAPKPAEPVAAAPEPAPAAPVENLDGFYEDTEAEYVPDEELIDPAEGYDPTPATDGEFSEQGFDPEASDGGETAAGEFADQ